MDVAQQPTKPERRASHHNVIPAKTLEVADRPACSEPHHVPAWWDLDTHRHDGRESCVTCRCAIDICQMCPVLTACHAWALDAQPVWFIAAGLAWKPTGVAETCAWCSNPKVATGRGRESGLCSLKCEREQRRDWALHHPQVLG